MSGTASSVIGFLSVDGATYLESLSPYDEDNVAILTGAKLKLPRIGRQWTFWKDVSQDYDPFKKLYLNTGWTKVRNFLSKSLTLLITKLIFCFKSVLQWTSVQ